MIDNLKKKIINDDKTIFSFKNEIEGLKIDNAKYEDDDNTISGLKNEIERLKIDKQKMIVLKNHMKIVLKEIFYYLDQSISISQQKLIIYKNQIIH
jgi:hypothetical protein